ncbi:hypothetical protein Vqi01_03500 [Micromonospora qiuiae]|uniref:Uncharacterized protein n=1 Tax=Micromonospora qiuiae TaxID=502268 RepID=A0ABQ4J574_9ACTN|nr:IniB N-terminal domain-containing protein [Micromonospora qiuiae]GIJ25188.1 hypothetical protein Vqi01_03500 [Micromonospora qiuiae]
MDQTLHDFVLNLLVDADARSAFDLDPESALRAAGLSDITAADVQDVVPLVIDYAPVHGFTSAAPAAPQLGVESLTGDSTDVIGQLQSVAQQLAPGGSQSGVDLNAGSLGALAVDPSTVTLGGNVLPGVGLGASPTGVGVGLDGVHDVANTLDAGVGEAIDRTTGPRIDDAVDSVGDPVSVVDGAGSGLLDTTAGLLPSTASHAGDLVGSLGVDDTLGGLGLQETAGGVVGSLDVPSTVGGVTSQVDGLLSGVTGGATGAVTGDATVSGEASTSTGGLLGLGDGLF